MFLDSVVVTVIMCVCSIRKSIHCVHHKSNPESG